MTDAEIAERVGWFLGAEPRPCSHMIRHTVYGSSDQERNGTWCTICGKALT
jgi:hypothetical protein